MQHNGGDLENMTAKLLEKHITDTIREMAGEDRL